MFCVSRGHLSTFFYNWALRGWLYPPCTPLPLNMEVYNAALILSIEGDTSFLNSIITAHPSLCHVVFSWLFSLTHVYVSGPHPKLKLTLSLNRAAPAKGNLRMNYSVGWFNLFRKTHTHTASKTIKLNMFWYELAKRFWNSFGCADEQK